MPEKRQRLTADCRFSAALLWIRRSSCRRNEAAFECAAVVKPEDSIFQLKRELRFYERCALERSLVPSAAATGYLAW